MKDQKLYWEVKDFNRAFWYIKASFKYTDSTPPTIGYCWEPNYDVWDVEIFSESLCQLKANLKFEVKTSPDVAPLIVDIVSTLRDHFFCFTDACFLEARPGVKPPDIKEEQ